MFCVSELVIVCDTEAIYETSFAFKKRTLDIIHDPNYEEYVGTGKNNKQQNKREYIQHWKGGKKLMYKQKE
jgi:hypothetical protein